MAPSISALVEHGEIEARAYDQLSTFGAALQFARTEGIFVAPETAHAVCAAIDEANKCKETGEKKVIAFNLSGHGHFDMAAYDAYMQGQLVKHEYSQEALDTAWAELPEVAL
jgi:tryptophan synthase beta chain